MPKITAMIHTSNDAARIGRALKSVRFCDEVLVVDHGSTDNTVEIATGHGAKVRAGILGVDDGAHIIDAGHDWVLCLLPSEALSEALERSLRAWRERDPGAATGFAVSLLHQKSESAWKNSGVEMRLANRQKINWTGPLPPNSNAPRLEGYLLQFKK